MYLFLNYVHSLFSRTGRAGNKGTAYTFITPEQVGYAGDIIKALELSESEVPENLRRWWEEYKKQAEAVSYISVPINLSAGAFSAWFTVRCMKTNSVCLNLDQSIPFCSKLFKLMVYNLIKKRN